MKNVGQALQYVQSQLEGLRNSVFETPPSDWSAFQQMQGEYRALKNLELALNSTPANSEDER